MRGWVAALGLTAACMVSASPTDNGSPGYVQHIYWAPGAAPSQGLAIAVQKTVFFGAYYGYEGGQPSFVTLIGTQSGGSNSRNFSGDVFRTTSNGNSTDVGNFTWEGNFFCNNAQPCGRLTMDSPLFSTGGTFFTRFPFNEPADVGHLTNGTFWTGQDICSVLPCPSFTHGIEIGDPIPNPAPSETFDGTTVAAIERQNNGNNGDAIGFVATTTFDPDFEVNINPGDPFRLVFISYPLLDGGTLNGGSDITMVCIGGNDQLFCDAWSLDEGEVPTQATSNFGTLHAVETQFADSKADPGDLRVQSILDQAHLQLDREQKAGSREGRGMGLVSDEALARMWADARKIRAAMR